MPMTNVFMGSSLTPQVQPNSVCLRRWAADGHDIMLFGANSMICSHALGVYNGNDAKDDYRDSSAGQVDQIAAGDFTNDSEYIRDLIRRDQARRARIDAIREELIKGETSGAPEPFDSDAFKEEMAAKYVGETS